MRNCTPLIPSHSHFKIQPPTPPLFFNLHSNTRTLHLSNQLFPPRIITITTNSTQTNNNTSDQNSELDKELVSTFDFLQLKRELEREESKIKDGLVAAEGVESNVLGADTIGEEGMRVRSGRQMIRRSSLLAKQVISVHSARSLGFISQLWVDTESWLVVLVEVRPNLLSGENDKFLLKDIRQVGDVVLVQDENVMENELKMVGLDTLVGYNVITSGRRNVGKVRGYTFNINSGAVESLELDSFGFSIIPASLVSTYGLFVEDVLEVAADTVVVHEDAASKVQRLTKGILDTRNVDTVSDEMEEYYNFRRAGVWPARSQSSQKFRGRKFPRKTKLEKDDWELPLDY